MEKYINEYIRPRLQGDGGEITFVEEKDGEVIVLLQGECSKCLILDRCLKWIEERIEVDETWTQTNMVYGSNLVAIVAFKVVKGALSVSFTGGDSSSVDDRGSDIKVTIGKIELL